MKILKFFILIFISVSLGLLSRYLGLNNHQSLAVSIFLISMLGTLFFWDFRLSFVFIGTSILLITRTIDLDNLISFASLEVILFLVGMMVLVGMLKESGFFAWIVSLILRIKNLTARKFIIAVSVISALLACAIDEVTSIIFVVAAVLEICDYFEVEPTPFIIISILATNIGSSGTVLGNPVGILIASKSGLTFEDFIFKAFPIMVLSLGVTILLVIYWYRRVLNNMDRMMREFKANDILIKLISVPPERQLKVGLAIFGTTLLFLALHHRLELFWNLEANTLLLTIPLVSAGFIMIWKWRKARLYIERDVEWWTLLFFMLLFAQAGTLKYTGTTDVIANKISYLVGHNVSILTTFILWISAFGSSILDNVVLVAAFIPVVQSMEGFGFSLQPLWWALLFGGCFGGNITIVGSTANIVALGILEKEKKIKINFFRWFSIGFVVALITTLIVWVSLLWLPIYH